MNKKGQGSLEYLLLIGGAVLVAVIVIALVITFGQTGGDTTTVSVVNSLCQQYTAQGETACGTATVTNAGTDYTCEWLDSDQCGYSP
ncbi:MAG: class III signal peptide-containing protein [Candidatus Diapherotrites archaeon]